MLSRTFSTHSNILMPRQTVNYLMPNLCEERRDDLINAIGLYLNRSDEENSVAA